MTSSSSTTSQQNEWIEKFARFGYGAKGIVYCLTGFIAMTAAFGTGNTNDTDKGSIISIIMAQPLGKILLGAVAVGLVGYVVWRGIEAIKDPHHEGTDGKGIIKRLGYAISALAYAAIAFSAFRTLVKGSSSGGESTQQTLIEKLLEQPYGQWVLGIIALIILIRGIMQIRKALSGKYRKGLKESEIPTKFKEILIKTGEAGYIARGVVWGVISFLFFRAAYFSNSDSAGSTEDALGLVKTDFGPYVLGFIALGLFCYGFFFILQGLYIKINVSGD